MVVHVQPRRQAPVGYAERRVYENERQDAGPRWRACRWGQGHKADGESRREKERERERGWGVGGRRERKWGRERKRTTEETHAPTLIQPQWLLNLDFGGLVPARLVKSLSLAAMFLPRQQVLDMKAFRAGEKSSSASAWSRQSAKAQGRIRDLAVGDEEREGSEGSGSPLVLSARAEIAELRAKVKDLAQKLHESERARVDGTDQIRGARSTSEN